MRFRALLLSLPSEKRTTRHAKSLGLLMPAVTGTVLLVGSSEISWSEGASSPRTLCSDSVAGGMIDQ